MTDVYGLTKHQHERTGRAVRRIERTDLTSPARGGIYIPQRTRIDARTGTPTELGDNQWTYPYNQIVKTVAGYGGWTVQENGLSDETTGEAFNKAEDANAATGVQGNGVDVANLTGTFEHQPIPENSIVSIEIVTFTTADGTETVEAWIDRVISVDGDC